MIMMYWCKFINCNKCSTLVEEVDIEEVVHVGGAQGVYGKSLYLLFDFAVNLKLL